MERPAGIEPASSAWKAVIIPLYQERITDEKVSKRQDNVH